MYLIATDSYIMRWNVTTMKIDLIRSISLPYNGSSCHVTDSWLLVTGRQGDTLYLDYYSLADCYTWGQNYYAVENMTAGFTGFTVGDDLYFVMSAGLQYFTLSRNCSNVSTISNVEACFYGKYICRTGYRGATCSEPACPNTLSLFDPQTYTQILHECNNRGTCSNGTCICDQYWTGEDCSIYTRKLCYGMLIQNRPVSNCECREQARGGNSCEVVFCYNDCSGQGTCLPSGECQCKTGYYGKDCSIFIIEFPGAPYSI